jgi:UDP-N-acetyl-D-galactosamine dehydrogenase
MADSDDALREHRISLSALDSLRQADAVILAVPHRQYRDGGWALIEKLLVDGRGLVVDVKSVLDRADRPAEIDLWRP